MPQKFLSSNLIKLLTVALLSLGLIFLNPKGIFTPLRNLTLEIAYPFQKTFYILSRTIAGTAEFLGSIGDLKNENENLLKENNMLAAEIAQLSDAKKENASLREQLDLAPRQKFDLEAAFVISQDPQRLDSWLLIDKGSSDGIQSGMAAVAFEGILVGKVSEVSAHTAKIILLSDSSSIINVVDNETQSKGILKGEFGLGVVMDMVSQQETLNNGDLVVTSGLGSEVPRGLLIGKIQEIRMTADKLFQQAVVAPRVKYSDLEMLYVIKN